MFAFINFTSVFVLFLFVGFIVSLNVLSLNSAYITHYFNFLGIGLVFLFIVVLTFFINKSDSVLHQTNHVWIIFILSLTTKLIFVMLVNSKPESDFETIFQTAGMYADGTINTFNVGPGGYYDIWAYQSVYTLYQALVLYLYHSIDALKLLNVFFMAGSSVMIYKICSTIFSHKIAFVTACLYSLYPEMIFYSPLLSNQHLSTFFVLLGIYFLLKNNYISLVFSGIFLALADLMRPEIIIVLVAAFFCLIVGCVRYDRNNVVREFSKFSIVLFIYIIIHLLTSSVIKLSGVNQYGIDNRNPEWKFMVGLDKEHLGAWNTSHVNILAMEDASERKKEIIDYVKATYKTPQDVASFVFDKQSFMWSSPSPVYFTFNDGELTRTVKLFGKEHYMNDLVNIFISVDKIYYTFILGLFLISVADVFLSMIRGVQPSRELYFIMMVCLVNFMIYLLIEVQPRYKYFVMPFVFIVAAQSLTRLNKLWVGRLKTLTLKVVH